MTGPYNPPGAITPPAWRPNFAAGIARLAEVLVVKAMRDKRPDGVELLWRRAPFRSQWGQTCGLLATELNMVGADACVLEVALRDRDFRNDGMPRADAKPEHPGVILSFTHPAAGALSYPAFTYDDWQDNVRAIALALNALRAVDRYGVTRSAEQYRGWKALPASTDSPPTLEEAARIIVAEAGATPDLAERVLNGSPETRRQWITEALKKTHPDAGGNADAFHRVQRARKVLEA